MEVGRFDDSGFMFEDVVPNHNTEGWLFHHDPVPPPPPPPPLFQGSITTLARPSDGSMLPRSNGLIDPFIEISSSNRSVYPPSATTSPTMLAAASTLMRNGQSDLHTNLAMNRIHNQFEDTPQPVLDNRIARDAPAFDQHSFAGHTRKLIGGSTSTFAPTQVPMIHNSTEITDRPNLESLSMPRQNLYGPGRSLPNGLTHSDGGPHLQWGSDGNFANNQFFPPAHLETVAHVTDGLLERVQTFAERTSANSTQPSSPIAQRSKNDSSIAKAISYVTCSKIDVSQEAEDANISPTWRKRRKARPEVKEEEDAPGDEEEDWQETVPRRGKRQKRSLGKVGKKSSTEMNHNKGRDSEATEQRPGRDNLTEEQRRENHILSEQKRRNLIKQGFDDLSELVPGLKSGGFSKSAMLTQAVEWLESLLDGNARLAAQLGELNGHVGS